MSYWRPVSVWRDERIIEDMKAEIRKQSRLKHIGKCEQILRMDMKWRHEGIFLISQTLLTLKLVNDQRIQNGEPGRGIADLINVESRKRAPTLGIYQRKMYRTITNSLMFFSTHTRPDLAVVASILSSHLNNLTTAHMAYAKMTLRYLEKLLATQWT